MKEEFKSITKRTQSILAEPAENNTLLLADGQRCQDALAAVANTGRVGHVLVGVRQHDYGADIAGCPDYPPLLATLDGLAAEITPAISITHSVENTAREPIVRIDVEVGRALPHMTPDGRYLVFEGGEIRPLPPERLRALVLRRQNDGNLELLDRLEQLHFNTAEDLQHLKDLASPSSTHIRMARFQNSLDAILRYFNIPDPLLEDKIEGVRRMCEVALMRGADDEEVIHVVATRFPTVAPRLVIEQLNQARERLDDADPGWRETTSPADSDSSDTA